MSGASSRSKKSISAPFANQRGQGTLEYLLVIIVIVTIFITVARPALERIQQGMGEAFQAGIFSDENDNFYYYPVRRR